jgi:hypothetical protein
MKKRIKKIGSGFGIYFDKEEQEIYDMSEGDIIEIAIIRLEKDNRK